VADVPTFLRVLSPISNLFAGKKGRPKSAPPTAGSPSSMKRGGKVRRGGLIKMHKGERVLAKKHRGKRRGSRKSR